MSQKPQLVDDFYCLDPRMAIWKEYEVPTRFSMINGNPESINRTRLIADKLMHAELKIH